MNTLKKEITYSYPSSPNAYQYNNGEGYWRVKAHEVNEIFQDDHESIRLAMELFISLPGKPTFHSFAVEYCAERLANN